MFILAQATTEQSTSFPLVVPPIGYLIAALMFGLGIIAIFAALLPKEFWQRFPILGIVSGLLGYFLIGLFISYTASNAWLLSLSPGIIGLVFTFLLVREVIHIEFIWGFFSGIWFFLLILAISVEWSTELLVGIVFLTIGIACLIYWGYIKKKMSQNFDNVQISLTMIGTAWTGVASALILRTLIPN